MNSLTQIVLGAAVGEAALGRKVGNKALLYGAIAGTIPDLDVIANYLTDTVTAIELHRGFSHSILFCIITAPALGWLVNKIERKYSLGWKPWAKLFFWGLFTHPLLDAFTTWGTQLFWPLNTRLAFNSIFVIDPLYTVPFLLFTVSLMFYPRQSVRRKSLNHLGLFLSTAYLLNTIIIKLAVQSIFEKALVEQGIAYSEISTRPAPLNVVLWNANVQTDDSYFIGDYSLFDTKPIAFKRFPKNREISSEIIRNPKVQRLIKISEGWYLMEQKAGDWYFYDLRFGLIPKENGESEFVFAYHLKEENGELRATEVPKTRADAKQLIGTLWERVKGN